MTMTSKVKPYKAGFGPFAPEVYRAPGPVPLPRGLERRRDRRPEEALQGGGRSRDRRVCRPRARPGRGRLHRDAGGLPRAPRRALPRVRDPLRRRRGAVGRRAGPGRCGRSSTTTASSPTCSSRGSRSAAGSRSPRSRPRGDHGRRCSRRARRHVRRQPALVRRGDRGARGGRGAGVPRAAPPSSARRCARASKPSRRSTMRSARCAGSARCSRSSSSSRPRTRRRRSSTRRSSAGSSCSPAVYTAMSSGCCPPLTIDDAELEEGLALLEESIAAAP